ncbi:polyprenyl synthetase family protein [Helicovermis profundi]|uniref:Farnesyl diphosphate synthase n=1 Tax=Helicovermis profundi TaxID=3065157 RepID=A0AAU9EEA1_9FIRM|nr:polyprenyl synthetase family protein [Clostridia bacterium S502]
MINDEKFVKLKTIIEKELLNVFPSNLDSYQQLITDAMKYSLISGGKRIRPILAIAVFELFSVVDDLSVKFLSSIEMIHTYSLIHDDLPSMDNDLLRRGKPTLHIEYGEDVAVLAGDALLNLAFENMIKIAIDSNGNNSYKYLKAMNVIASSSGYRGMILGQIADIKSEGIKIDKETLDYINLNKTGQLIKASMLSGAIIGNASDEDLKRVKKIALNIGKAFQIVDDILDIEGSEEKLGKTTGSDEVNGKVTYPSLIGIENSKKEVEKLSMNSIKILREINADTVFLEKLILFLINREK